MSCMKNCARQNQILDPQPIPPVAININYQPVPPEVFYRPVLADEMNNRLELVANQPNGHLDNDDLDNEPEDPAFPALRV